ncbi:MAG: GIY-YIG nuclease family protein [Candidatus Marinimicrobia bacterium]|nr:GIY-YIG nuclease family protein [Candidatus Neomarinimicrobiota bacterium]
MYHTYILYSKRLDRYYTGHSGDLSIRTKKHNQGLTRSTKGGVPWELVYTECFSSRSEAMRREYVIKKWKSRKLIEELIDGLNSN